MGSQTTPSASGPIWTIVPAQIFPPTTVRSHRTRLFLEASGTPRRLVTSWTFDAADPVGDGTGSIVLEIEGLGMYVTFADPLGGLQRTSHDIIVGADDENQAITEPWRKVVPAGLDLASIEITFAQPREPIMLGIEGAIAFISSHDASGAVTLDRIIDLFGSREIDVAPEGRRSSSTTAVATGAAASLMGRISSAASTRTSPPPAATNSSSRSKAENGPPARCPTRASEPGSHVRQLSSGGVALRLRR